MVVASATGLRSVRSSISAQPTNRRSTPSKLMLPLISLSAAAFQGLAASHVMMPSRLGASHVVMQARPLVGASGDISKSTKAAFKRVDLDGNELIDRNEMQLALKRLGMSASDERADGLFATVQTDAKGVIDYSQFEELLLTASFDPETFSEADFKTAFDAVDADGNGGTWRIDPPSLLGAPATPPLCMPSLAIASPVTPSLSHQSDSARASLPPRSHRPHRAGCVARSPRSFDGPSW